MFAQDIDRLINSNRHFLQVEKNNRKYTLVKCPTKTGGYRFYAIDHKSVIGQGTYGIVYQAYEIDPKTCELAEESKFAAKIYKKYEPECDEEALDREVAFLRRFFKTEQPIPYEQNKKESVIVITELLPGEDLETKDGVNPIVWNMPFEQRTSAIVQLALWYNQFHHNKPLTGEAFIHGDTKSANLKIFRDKNGRVFLFPMDFGLSILLNDRAANPNKRVIHTISGVPEYFPPETISDIGGEFGIKTDINMLAYPILILLNVDDPLNSRRSSSAYRDYKRIEQTINTERGQKLIDAQKRSHRLALQISEIPFDTQDITEFPPDLHPTVGIRELTLSFIKRMQNSNYEKRPDSDDLLRFFTALNMLITIHLQTPNDLESKNLQVARMLLLATGLSEEIYTIDQEQKKIGDFNLYKQPEICEYIVTHHTKQPQVYLEGLRKQILKVELRKLLFARAMITLEETNDSSLFVPVNGVNYSIVRCPVPKKKNSREQEYHYYAIEIDNRRRLGRGTSGQVYKAYQIDPVSHDIIPDKQFVAKKFIAVDDDEFANIETESTFLNRFFRTERPIRDGNTAIIITEFLPGEDLGTIDKANPLVQTLNFSQRLSAIAQLPLWYNQFHHNKPQTGTAFVHGDTKPSNIRIYKDDNGRVFIYPMDFGLSVLLNDPFEDANKKVTGMAYSGNPVYFPLETIARNNQAGEFSTKTDIDMLTYPILTLLGVMDPKALRQQEYDTDRSNFEKVAAMPFSTQGVVDFEDLYPGIDLKAMTLKFIEMMQEPDYKKRPDSDEVLRFFTALNNLNIIHEADSNDMESKKVQMARMCLLVQGMAHETYLVHETDPANSKEIKMIEFDFSHAPNVCDYIIDRYQSGEKINVKALEILMKSESQPTVAQSSDNNNRLFIPVQIIPEDDNVIKLPKDNDIKPPQEKRKDSKEEATKLQLWKKEIAELKSELENEMRPLLHPWLYFSFSIFSNKAELKNIKYEALTKLEKASSLAELKEIAAELLNNEDVTKGRFSRTKEILRCIVQDKEPKDLFQHRIVNIHHRMW